MGDDLKKMGRIIEKTILKRPDDLGNANKVCDIVRGMVTCDNMTQIADVVGHIGASDDIVVARVKDRFFEAPSAGGWRDCMINFYVKSDVNKHICEVQVVHKTMMTARKGLPGHAVYNRVRNASELLLAFPKEQPKNRKELQVWLTEYHAGKDWKVGDKNGDKFERGPPNLWDVSKVEDIGGLFKRPFGTDSRANKWPDALKDFNEDISGWNVSNVKDMSYMFSGTTAFN